MPIGPFLDGSAFAPEAIRNISVVFETVCAELGLRDKDDRAMRLGFQDHRICAERRRGRCNTAVKDT